MVQAVFDPSSAIISHRELGEASTKRSYSADANHADTNSALLFELENLKSAYAALKEENSKLRENFTTLRQHSGVSFAFFPKLPLELRRKVWRFVCWIPQVHIITDERMSRSNIYNLMITCKESRIEAAKIKFDCVIYQGLHHVDGFRVDNARALATTKNYFNLEKDTIWFNQTGCISEFLLYLRRICKKCNKTSLDITLACTKDCLPTRLAQDGQDVQPLQALALNIAAWDDLNDYAESLPMIAHCQAKELMIVVGDCLPNNKHTGATFVSPTMSPQQRRTLILSTGEAPTAGTEMLKGAQTTWISLQERIYERFQEFKSCRQQGRQFAVDSKGQTFEDIDADPRSSLRDLTDWAIPRIRFVEAVSEESRTWIERPEPSIAAVQEMIERDVEDERESLEYY